MSLTFAADFSDFLDVDIVPSELSSGDGSTGADLWGMLTDASGSWSSFSVEALRDQEDSSSQFSIKSSLSGPVLVSVCCASLCLGRFALGFGSSPVLAQRRRLAVWISNMIHCSDSDN